MNILLLSVGTRNKIVQYFRRAVGETGRVIATDMSELAPAAYEADRFYQVPPISAPGYLERIFDICEKEQISGVLSLIDPELSLLAQHRADFAARGVTVIGSSYALCEMALDKMQMYRWLTAHGYRCAKSFADKDAFLREVEAGRLTFPAFVKPIRGSASMQVTKVSDRVWLDMLFDRENELMVQEYLHGQEIGADVYIDLISGEPVSVFTKEKLVMRAGETDKSRSFKDPALFDLILRFVRECGWRGQIDIDIFRVDGAYYISEVNPRFGGGYPHAYECGCNHMDLILNNLAGRANPVNIGNYRENVFMMKYNEIMIR